MATKADAPYVTKAMIQEYLELEEERKRLDRDARALAKKASAIAAKLLTFVKVHGGKERSVVRSGYRLAIDLAPGYPSWKQEFVRVAGLDEANRISAEQPKREVLSINPA